MQNLEQLQVVRKFLLGAQVQAMNKYKLLPDRPLADATIELDQLPPNGQVLRPVAGLATQPSTRTPQHRPH